MSEEKEIEDNNNNEENELDDVNDYENLELLEKGEENDLANVEEYKEKIRRTGVIYISHIPIGMTVNNLKKLLKDFGVTRVYLVPLKEKVTDENGKKVQGYKEGWCEFEEKLLAKLAEYKLNGKPIGGKRTCPYKDDLWTIKYLHKFKWHHLTEKMNFNKNVREKRLKAEMAQSKRENEFILKNFEKSKMLNKKKNREDGKEEEKEEKEDKGLEDIKKRFKQKKPIIKNNK